MMLVLLTMMTTFQGPDFDDVAHESDDTSEDEKEEDDDVDDDNDGWEDEYEEISTPVQQQQR